MATFTQNHHLASRAPRSTLFSMITLAFWRLRQSSLMLFITGLGMTCAVMVVCALPLLQLLTTTSALRDLLRATPTNAEITTQASGRTLASSLYTRQTSALAEPFADQLTMYLQQTVQANLHLGNLPVISPQAHSPVASYTLLATNINETTSHLKLIAGRLPHETSGAEIEVALSQQTAQELSSQPITPGTLLRTRLSYQVEEDLPPKYASILLTFRVVGIFNASVDDPYWHGDLLNPTVEGDDPPKVIHYPLLLPLQTLLRYADQIAQQHTAIPQLVLEKPFTLTWYRHLDTSSISGLQLTDLNQRLLRLQAEYATNFGQSGFNADSNGDPYFHLSEVTLSGAVISVYNQPGILGRLQNRLSVANIPIYVVSGALVMLVLYFVVVMTSLLVEQQTPTIAMLRSRGASGRQIFLTLAIQCILLALVALLLGPLLALLLVTLYAPRLLAATSLDALNVFWPNPLPALNLTPLLALGTVAISVLVILFSLLQALRSNILAQRRQSVRSAQVPFWQRFYLDVVALLIALTAYIIITYISSYANLLDVSSYLLIVSPLRIIAPIFLVISLMLLFLRLFPRLLNLIASLAQRGNSAAPMLAFAQMTRSPQRALQMLLLFSLACAFAFMSLIFSSTQDAHLTDVANYQAMSDFSAQIASIGEEPLSTTYSRYKVVHGTTSISLGYVNDGSIYQSNTPARLFAIDAATFAQTILWNPTNSTQTLPELMHELTTKGTSADLKQGIPAIIDNSLWNQLHLHGGDTLRLQGASTGDTLLQLVVIDHVEHIQSLNNNTNPEISYMNPLPGGILVDFSTMNRYQDQDGGQFTSPNYVWLRTPDDSATLKNVRNGLSNPDLALVNITDRRALVETLHHDSFTLELLGLISIGTVTALVLALFGNIIAAWQSARSRLTNFAILRALGTDARQVGQVLFWEQCTIYVTALALGIIFAIVLALMVVPNLVFTTTPVSGANSYLGDAEFYALQYIIPTRLVYPPSLMLAFLFFVAVCIGAIILMIRIVLRPTLSHMLRLNED